MDKSIENIWKEGFANEELILPKVNELYNKRSISMVEKVIDQFKKEISLLIPAAVCVFLFNLLLDNDHAVFWGIVSALPCFAWFYIGKRQIKLVRSIDYQSNSYQYLVSIRSKLERIVQFNKKLAISSVPIILLPMLIYTYYNQQGKSVGEIFGIEGVDLPTIYIFLLLPVFTLISGLIAKLFFKRNLAEKTNGIKSIISEMEELGGVDK